MGAINIMVYEKGDSMAEAFRIAREVSEIELGTDYYNGGINNCSLVNDWTNRYNGKNLNKLESDALDYCGKTEVIGICIDKPIPNKNKTKSQVENIAQKGTRKWETVYQGVSGSRVVCEGKTQSDCIKKSREYVEKNKDDVVRIMIAKRLSSGNEICAKVSYKKSNKERRGKYVFIGLAPY